jgi:hypothetical protein
MVLFEPPIFYGYQELDPWVFSDWLFEMDQFFKQVSLSDDKEKVKSAKTKVAARPLEY